METDGSFGILKLFIILINVLYHEIKKNKINTMGVEHSNTYEIRSQKIKGLEGPGGSMS